MSTLHGPQTRRPASLSQPSHAGRAQQQRPCRPVQRSVADSDSHQQLGNLLSSMRQRSSGQSDDAVKNAEKLANSIATQLSGYSMDSADSSAAWTALPEDDEVASVLAQRLREQEALLSSLQGALKESESKRGQVRRQWG
jgi:hypothetical protein